MGYSPPGYKPSNNVSLYDKANGFFTTNRKDFKAARTAFADWAKIASEAAKSVKTAADSMKTALETYETAFGKFGEGVAQLMALEAEIEDFGKPADAKAEKQIKALVTRHTTLKKQVQAHRDAAGKAEETLSELRKSAADWAAIKAPAV